MATLISANGGGNWTTLATWRNACTGSGASLLTLTTAVSQTNTTYVYGVAFTVTNAEVIEGFALHLQRSGTTGTLTVALSDDGGTTATREVTVNLSDLPANYSWVFFKFGSTLTADGGSDYKVGIKLSSGSSGVTIYRGSATTGDWSHLLREDSAPGSLSAGDVFYIVDDLTGAGTNTANTVTMNNTDTTDFGAIIVGAGMLTFEASAATNYYLKTSGVLNVWGGGTLNIGTVAIPMPSDSTAVLEFDCTVDGEFGILIAAGGTVVAQGASMTKVCTLLSADASVNATTLTTDDITGWKDNDDIVIASTTTTPTQTESGKLNGNASGTTLTIDSFTGAGGGLAYAHSGNAAGGPNSVSTQAEIINLTRNVKIRSSSATYGAYIKLAGTLNFDYVECYYLGSNNTSAAAMTPNAATATFTIDYCSFHDLIYYGIYIAYGMWSNSALSFSNNVITRTSGLRASFTLVGAPTNLTADDNWIIGPGAASVSMISTAQRLNRWKIAGTPTNRAISFSGSTIIPAVLTDCVFHSNGAGLGTEQSTTLSGCTIWRNGSPGIGTGISMPAASDLSLLNCHLFGNTTYNIQLASNPFLQMDTCYLNGESSYATGVGIALTGTYKSGKAKLRNCNLGGVTGHTSGDIYIATYNSAEIEMHSTILASANEVVYQTPTASPKFCYVRSHKHDADIAHKSWYRDGILNSEASTRHTASGLAWKMTPSYAYEKLIFPGPTTFDTFKAAVVASAAVTITAWVRKDSSYNGNAPRLVLIGGYIGGIAANVVASLSVGADTWEQLSVSGTPNEAGVIEWYIDCDGTAGSVYVDDMAVSQSGLPSADNLDYVSWGLPLTAPYTLGGGGGTTVIVIED